MNVNGISPTAAIAGQSASERAAVPAPRTSDESANTPQIDKATGEPVALHFPWLSRITMKLEQASNRPSPYGTATPLGENVNQKV
jgi:hypothetical protein